MKRPLHFGWSCAMGLLLAMSSGCSLYWAKYRYSYDGEWFSTPQQMFAAQATLHERLLQTIAARQTPLVTECVVVVPRREILQRNAVFYTDDIPRQEIALLAEVVWRELIFVTRAIEKRHLCGSIVLRKSDGRHVKPAGSETYIYVFSPEEGTVDWYVVEAGHPRRPVPDDRRIVDNSQHVGDWLRRLESRIRP